MYRNYDLRFELARKNKSVVNSHHDAPIRDRHQKQVRTRFAWQQRRVDKSCVACVVNRPTISSHYKPKINDELPTNCVVSLNYIYGEARLLYNVAGLNYPSGNTLLFKDRSNLFVGENDRLAPSQHGLQQFDIEMISVLMRNHHNVGRRKRVQRQLAFVNIVFARINQ